MRRRKRRRKRKRRRRRRRRKRRRRRRKRRRRRTRRWRRQRRRGRGRRRKKRRRRRRRKWRRKRGGIHSASEPLHCFPGDAFYITLPPILSQVATLSKNCETNLLDIHACYMNCLFHISYSSHSNNIGV
jgi:hypothetical protein